MELEEPTGLGGVTWQTLWEQLSGPIAVADLQGRTVDVNPALCRMLGYDRATLRALPPPRKRPTRTSPCSTLPPSAG